MRIIPVLDILGGVVVRAIAGQRHRYAPIESQLVVSPEPFHVASRLLEVSGATELYLADLDAIITGQPVNNSICDLVRVLGVPVWFDGGFRSTPQELDPLIRPVIGSETFGLPSFASRSWAYSLDLREGVPLGCVGESALSLANRAVEMGFLSLIVLDLAQVGTNRGPGTLELLGQIRTRHPSIELIAGGGVRDRDDWNRLSDIGVDAVLVASALHDGNIDSHFTSPRQRSSP